MPIAPLLVDKTVDFVSKEIKSAKVLINNEYKEFPIDNTSIENGVITKFVYITNDEGQIGRARLLDSLGRELQYRDFNIKKGPDGTMLVFKIRIKLLEG